jgi:hypothetical protein
MSRIQHTPTVVETPVNETLATPQPEPVAPANAVEVRLTSAQLKERLDETRAAAERRVLAELGVDDLSKAKELLSKAAPRTDEKWQSLEASAAQQAEKLAEMESLLAAVAQERATSALAALPEQARKAIEDATDDPEERVALVQVFQAAGFSPASVAAPAAVAPPSAPAASTAPPRSAPADASMSQPDRKAEYQRLKEVNPVAAAHFLKRHLGEIFPR